MATIQFSKAEFESALPVDSETGEQLWTWEGLIKGEETYRMKVKSNIYIEIRSSIDDSGYAKVSGEDSIRLSLLYHKKGNKFAQPLGKSTYTQRTAGWESRLKTKLRELYGEGLDMKTCPMCGAVLSLRDGKYGQFYGCAGYPNCKYTEKVKDAVDEIVEELAVEDNSFDDLLDLELPDTDGLLDTAELDAIIEEEERGEPVTVKKLNPQQLAFATAPIDKNIRVIAGPGSGKTTTIIERIVYLIEQGVDPDTIVYVTYTKAMATEGYERILARLPEVADTNLKSQICTIHAFCYRILKADGDKRQLAEQWRVKQILEDLINGKKGTIGEFEGYEKKPSWKEVYHWICFPKRLGIEPTDISNFYRESLDFTLALKTERIYTKFNHTLRALGLITFPDMLYDVEQKLIHNKNFRLGVQSRYHHIIVDEAQDVNEQALRILMTIAKES